MSRAHSPTFIVTSPTSQFILQPFFRFSYVTSFSLNELCSFSNLYSHFTYVTTHSPTLPSLYLRHSSFSNPSVALPTSQFILQPFFRFSYVTSSSLSSPGEPPMVHAPFLFLCHVIQDNSYFNRPSDEEIRLLFCFLFLPFNLFS